MWKIRDNLKADLNMPQLRQMLEANNQSIPSGESKVHSLIIIYVISSFYYINTVSYWIIVLMVCFLEL